MTRTFLVPGGSAASERSPHHAAASLLLPPCAPLGSDVTCHSSAAPHRTRRGRPQRTLSRVRTALKREKGKEERNFVRQIGEWKMKEKIGDFKKTIITHSSCRHSEDSCESVSRAAAHIPVLQDPSYGAESSQLLPQFNLLAHR